MKGKETSINYVSNIIGGLQKELLSYKDGRKVNPEKISEYYISLLAIQLAIPGEIKGYGKFLGSLESIENGGGKINAALGYLKQLGPGILEKVKTAAEMDKTLVGRTNPSSLKRDIITRKAEILMSQRGEYGSQEHGRY